MIGLGSDKNCPNFVDIPPKQSQSWLSCDQLISSRAPPQLFAGNMNRANIWVCRSRNKYEDKSFVALGQLRDHFGTTCWPFIVTVWPHFGFGMSINWPLCDHLEITLSPPGDYLVTAWRTLVDRLLAAWWQLGAHLKHDLHVIVR